MKNHEEAKEFAESIRSAVEALEWENGSRITISVGVAYTDAKADILKEADECLYTSKKTGKNKVTYSSLL